MAASRDHLAYDHYTLLGVGRAAAPAELRRAFRTLALRHHPDRAGAASTEVFQRISEAYAVLSDPVKRARYDDHLPDPAAGRGHRPHDEAGVGPGRPSPAAAAAPAGDDTGQYEGPGGRIGWRRERPRSAPRGPMLQHLCGALDALLTRGLAHRRGDGVIELDVDPVSADTGGWAAIDAAISVTCPTCAGHAEPNVLWCRRCEHAGTVIDHVTFTLELPAHVRDGAVFTFVTDPSGNSPPFRVRLRVA
jgi:DnaJ-class molecular chaperone